MGRSSGKYGGYRGRRTLTDLLRIIAIILGVAVILVLAGLFLAQDYIVYTDDGIRLELPFLADKEEPVKSSPDPNNITVKEETKEEEPVVETAPAIKAVQLPVSTLLEGTAQTLMEQAGANALILEMKGQDGSLAWHSDQNLAEEAGVNGDQAVNDALQKLEEQGIYTVALVCCFRDDSIPYYDTDLALRSSGGNWRDELGFRWMSPGAQQARDYVTALCEELAGLGFDEILLESFAFPTRGDLGRIVQGEAYDPDRLTDQVRTFLEGMQQMLAPKEATLALRIQADDLTGQEEAGGLNLQMLKDIKARLWLEEEAGQTAPRQLLAQAGIEEERLVEITAELNQDSQIPQGCLSS